MCSDVFSIKKTDIYTDMPGLSSMGKWEVADRRCSNYIWMINNFIAY